MKKLNIFEKLFISISFAEERIFKNINWREILYKWNQLWVTIAFAEEGLIFPANFREKNLVKKQTEQCEFGDASCFLARNA